MKTIFGQALFIFLLFEINFSFAQKIEWSNTRNEDTKYDYIKILGSDEDGYFVLKSNLPFEYKRDSYGFRNRKFSIAYFDNKMNLKMQKSLVPPQKDSHLLKVVFVNEKVLLINDIIDKETQQYHFYAQWLNSEGISEKAAVKIGEFHYDSKSDLENVNIIISKDQNLICLITPDIEEFKDKQTLTATAVDTSLAVIWKKKLEIHYNKKIYNNQSTLLSNDGNIYLLGNLNTYSDENSFHVFSYDYKKNVQSETPININENLSDVSFAFDNINKKLTVAGLYTNKGTSGIVGTFFANIDILTSVVTDIKTQRFDSKLIDLYPNLNQYNNNGRESNYSINRLILRNDGGVVILAEVNFITQNSYYDYFSRSLVNKWIYHFDTILTVSINPDGKIDWQQSISKNQESQDDGGYYSSFCSLIYGSKMNILYNNSIDRNNTVLAHTINNKGIREQKILINEVEKVMLIPRSALQTDDNTLIIPAIRDRKFCYAKITF